MNRRGFLSLFGAAVAGAAIEQVIPLGRVWSFPKEIALAQPCTVRFIRAWDPTTSQMICRFDALYGFAALTPRALESYEAVEIIREWQMQPALDQLAQKYKAIAPPAKLLRPVGDDAQIRGVHTMVLVR